jgi:NAD(P)-dependent dehydrogenase (short-subunit alcohol dehydrogenase family)
VFPQGNINSQSVREFERTQAINVTAVYEITKQLLPALLRAPQPAIVIVSSAVFRIGLADSPAYAASKAAQIGLTRHLAAELGGRGIRVNCVLPGLVDTPGSRTVRIRDEEYAQFAEERQMLRICLSPEDIAHGIVFLCSPAARAITAASLDMNAGLAVGG